MKRWQDKPAPLVSILATADGRWKATEITEGTEKMSRRPDTEAFLCVRCGVIPKGDDNRVFREQHTWAGVESREVPAASSQHTDVPRT